MRRIIAILLLLLITVLPSCGNESDAIPEEQSLVAHAGGAVYGFRLTNSLEALDNAYKNGFRMIELDFELTLDGEYVLIHDWESMAERMLFERGVHTLKEFQEASVFMNLTLLDLSELIDWVAKHKDCYIITDAKCENIPFLERLYELSGELSGNFIPQVYSYEQYSAVNDIGYERIILTLYRMANIDHTELFNFVVEKKPFGITFPMERLDTEIVRALDEIGVNTYAHSVNDLSFFEKWREHGLDGIYTDYFSPVKWPY